MSLDATSIIDYTHEDFVKGIDNIAKQVIDSGWNPDIIVGIVRGGAIPAVYLSHKLKKTIQMVHWSSRDSHLAGGNETNAWLPEEINYGAKVLVVDDIVDGGDTIRELLEDWQKSIHRRLCTENIRIAALHYNIAQDVVVHYYDQTIDRNEDSRWVVYPWEA